MKTWPNPLVQRMRRLQFGRQWSRTLDHRRSTYMPLLQFILLCVAILCAGCAGQTPSKADLSSKYRDAAISRLSVLMADSTNVQWIRSIRDLPRPIRKSLAGVADAGEPFSAGCTGPFAHCRFLAATRSDGTYYVALEFGGYGYSWDISQVTLDEHGQISHAEEVEPSGAANRGQPIRGHTNPTSAAAGPDP